MIVTQPYGVSPTFDLTIGGASVDYTSVQGFELTLSENQHDMLALEIVGLPPRAITDYISKGVRLQFHNGAGYREDFYGYVVSVEPSTTTAGGLVNQSPFQHSTVRCLGATYALRGAKSHVWSNLLVKDVVSQVLAPHMFSVDVPQDPIRIPSYVQTSQSDWQFLVAYAELLGYTLGARGTHLYFYDLSTPTRYLISYNKLLTMRGGKASNSPHPGQILRLRGSFGEFGAASAYKNTAVTVDAGDQTYQVTSNEILKTKAPFQDVMPEYVDTYDRARRIISNRSKADFDFKAHVECVGIAGVRPGGLVDLDEFNASYDGLWLVRNVVHRVNSRSYLTELDIVRGKEGFDVVGNPSKPPRPPEPEWVKGAWRSKRREVREYA